ncbi:hypothetical protein [Tamlana sp. I1]|uniref:hypothetical protein n=1 Tax=Tamlana sp. I1 TaxID=2762061 RepID=UPI00188F9C10|nr:hypothetical protein [Tamlana sp. I1]
MKKIYVCALAVLGLLYSCSNSDDDTNHDAKLIVKLKFDKDQVRLNNVGEPATIAPGHAAQTPEMKLMSAHYLELAPNATTLLGEGEVLYKGEETSKGGESAIDFNKSILVEDGEVFLEIPLSQLNPGTYSWVRISASYEEGDIKILNDGNEYNGTVAAFLGYINYIESFSINEETVEVNENKLQGFWAFEAEGLVFQGQAPEGAITVPNPLFETSPIPEGSCVLTGEFSNALKISGNETQDITLTLSFSVNNSFEWEEVVNDGKYEPTAGENVVDMGLRGLIPSIN